MNQIVSGSDRSEATHECATFDQSKVVKIIFGTILKKILNI